MIERGTTLSFRASPLRCCGQNISFIDTIVKYNGIFQSRTTNGTAQTQLAPRALFGNGKPMRSEEHTSELQSLMRISYAVFCLKKKNKTHTLMHNMNEHN